MLRVGPGSLQRDLVLKYNIIAARFLSSSVPPPVSFLVFHVFVSVLLVGRENQVCSGGKGWRVPWAWLALRLLCSDKTHVSY